MTETPELNDVRVSRQRSRIARERFERSIVKAIETNTYREVADAAGFRSVAPVQAIVSNHRLGVKPARGSKA